MSEMSSDSKPDSAPVPYDEKPYPFFVWTPRCDHMEGYETLQEAIDHAENYGTDCAPHFVLELRQFIARSSSEDAIEEAKKSQGDSL
jgi:hypothetical protein